MFARGKELDHWNEMVANQKDQITHWHALVWRHKRSVEAVNEVPLEPKLVTGYAKKRETCCE